MSDGLAERGEAGYVRYPAFLFRAFRASSSPYINHFISADTIVPDPANPQSLNRYSYVMNNPLRYTDPTGHYCVEEDGSGNTIQMDCDSWEPIGGGGSNGGENGGSDQDNSSNCDVEFCYSAWSQPDYWDLNPSHPDYYAFTVNWWFFTGAFIVDRYGQAYYAMGGNLGIPEIAQAGTASLTAGRIGAQLGDQPPGVIPYQLNMPSFLEGLTINAAGGFVVGGGSTFSPGTLDFVGTGWNRRHPDVAPVAFEVGGYTPSYGVTVTSGNQIHNEAVTSFSQSIIRHLIKLLP